MEDNSVSRVYKTLGKIFGIILLLVGIGALSGGVYAGNFIAGQLAQQDITMPTKDALAAQVKAGSITQADADVLTPYAGQKMSTGKEAKAYADNFVAKHMAAAAKAAGLEGATYATLGQNVSEAQDKVLAEVKAAHPDATEEEAQALADKEIADPTTTSEAAKTAASLQSLRIDTFLNGSTIRGTLLNVYGWSVVGKVALWAGVALGVIGLVLTVYGFVPAKKAARKAE